MRRTALAAASAGLGLALLAACGSSGTSAGAADVSTSKAGVATAKKDIAATVAPITSWPAVAPVANPVDLHGKRILMVPLGESIPVIEGNTLAAKAALEHMGAKVSVCDGKFNPSAVTSCLQQGQSQHVDAVMSLFVDYEMAPNAFDSLAKSGVKVLVSGEPADGGKSNTADFAFFDNSANVGKLDALLSEAALSDLGTGANALWLRLIDSPTTTRATQSGVDRFKELCPACGLATTAFTTANVDKLPSSVSAALVSHPKTNVVVVPVDSFVGPVLQGIQSAGFSRKVEVVSASSDLAGLQRVKAGQQAHDMGTSVVYEGYKAANAMVELLSGAEVKPDAQMITRDFDKSTVGSLPLTTAAYNTTQWFGNDSFEQAFYQAWGAQ